MGTAVSLQDVCPTRTVFLFASDDPQHRRWRSASMLSGELPGGCHHYAKNARRANFHAATPAPGYILGRLMRYVPESTPSRASN
jgi:hypothetical protein